MISCSALISLGLNVAPTASHNYVNFSSFNGGGAPIIHELAVQLPNMRIIRELAVQLPNMRILFRPGLNSRRLGACGY